MYMKRGVMDKFGVLIASDSFKGSASSQEVNDLLEQGVRRVMPRCLVRKFAIADGGEGTVEALTSAHDGMICEVIVSDPLGQPVCAHYGLVGSDIAIIEIAEASGITLIEQTSENARRASSFGVGQIICEALNAGVHRILIGLGGSATSDGGVGMAKALGVRFYNKNGQEIPCGLTGLEQVSSIDTSQLDPRIQETEFIALTDVSNPLCGERGAVYVYGPQKGIKHHELAQLDAWMEQYARVIDASVARPISELPGAGAAGGLGIALVAFCHASIQPGIEFILDALHLEDAMDDIDLVLTGEGRMDAQSSFGKAPIGIAKRAKRQGVPAAAVVGSRSQNVGSVYEEGIDLVIPAITEPCTLQECFAHVRQNVPLAAETAIRAFLLGRDKKLK